MNQNPETRDRKMGQGDTGKQEQNRNDDLTMSEGKIST